MTARTDPLRIASLLATTLVAMVLQARPAEAQGAWLELGYGLGTLTTDDWSPLRGFAARTGVEVAGGWEVGVDVRSTARGNGRIDRYCGFASCREGPFDESVFLRSLGASVGRRVNRSPTLDLRAEVRGGIFEQGRHMTAISGDDHFDRSTVIDYGLGVRLEARSRRRIGGVSPAGWVLYDAILQRECPADGTCFGRRNHFEVGVGLVLGG